MEMGSIPYQIIFEVRIFSYYINVKRKFEHDPGFKLGTYFYYGFNRFECSTFGVSEVS